MSNYLRATMLTSTTYPLLLLSSHVYAAALNVRSGVAYLDVNIPSNRKDDQYYTVDIDFDGQSLPVMLDTGSSDLFVASTDCDNVNISSGCYLSKEYNLTQPTIVLEDEVFSTLVGESSVYGPQSIMTVGFGGITLQSFGIPLINVSGPNEFQNGSFSGIFGLALRNISRNYYFNNRLPVIDTLITSGLLSKPLFSLSVPRLGDEESETGRLTIGDIEPRIAEHDIAYSEIINVTNWNYESHPLTPQGWTIQLQAIRVNGADVNISSLGLLQDGRYLSDIDSGSPKILVREEEFNAMTKFFKGKLIIFPGHDIYFECRVPQIIELKYHDRWYPVDPLDMIIPSDHGVVNGTLMCHAALGSWDRDFADSIIGVPFLRSTYAVFDYQSTEMYSKQPRVGLASHVDIGKAVERYPSTYQKRLR